MISTPYHGYFKNLAIAAVGGFDNHVKPLCDDGYVKFWSVHTLRTLLEEAGLRSIEFVLVWAYSCAREIDDCVSQEEMRMTHDRFVERLRRTTAKNRYAHDR
jgi:hypothetical protein